MRVRDLFRAPGVLELRGPVILLDAGGGVAQSKTGAQHSCPGWLPSSVAF